MNMISWLYWRFRWYVYPRRRYVTRCQYCAVKTGVTPHAWATDAVCSACAVPSDDLDVIRDVPCALCGEPKPPPSCDDDMPNVCDDCWNTHSTAPEAIRARERYAGDRA